MVVMIKEEVVEEEEMIVIYCKNDQKRNMRSKRSAL